MTARLRLAAALVVLAGAAPAGPDKVDDFVRAFILRHNIPSAAVAVVKDGRVVKTAGYGMANLELQVPATAVTVYEIGSITKQFTAQAAMMLVQDGRLRLDDRLHQYVKDIPPAWSDITIRHLLTHTSGLHDWEAAGEFSYWREYTPAEFITLVAKYPLDFAPGSQWSYTNSAYPLLGLAIEAVTGQPFEQFATDRIFARAGMVDTRFKHPQDIVRNRSGGYVDRNGVLVNGEPMRPRIIAPNGGIMSTAADMAKWDMALGAGLLVNRVTLDEMQAPIRLSDGQAFNTGFAWFIDTFRGHRLVLHNGSTVAGYSSVVYRYLDDRLSVVVLMNIDRWNAVNALATRVAGFYVPGLSMQDLPERPDPDPAFSRKLLSMLADVAAGRDSELLAPNLRDPGRPPRVGRTRGFEGTPDRFVFLEREDLGALGEMKYGNRLRWIYRYKLIAGSRTLFYWFEVTPDGHVARFFPEPA